MGIELRGNETVFALRGSDYAGFVIARIGIAHEDEGRHDDPSYFTDSFMSNNEP